jgi:hypothetical protein
VKNAAFLIFCLGVLFPAATGIFLHSSSQSARLPVRVERPAPDSVAPELEKTRSTLQRFEASIPEVSPAHWSEIAQDNTPEWFPGPEVSVAAPAQSGAPSGAPDKVFPVPPLNNPRLSFIFLSPYFRRAVIDGHLAREGDLLPGGARLVAIRDGSVVIRRGGKRQRIDIPAVFPEPPARMP